MIMAIELGKSETNLTQYEHCSNYPTIPAWELYMEDNEDCNLFFVDTGNNNIVIS